MNRSGFVLPVIVFSQFCCTSLWFAGNAVMPDLLVNFKLSPEAVGYLTAAVQFGFITGTLFFALFNVADRFSPSKVFFFSALFGALINLGMVLEENSAATLVGIRFFTGFSLAGIYPVGMKIAADYYQKGLGTSLGYLVGALVLGTAFPHLLRTFTAEALPWRIVLFTTSGLAGLGGILIFFLVGDGPFRSPAKKVNFSAFSNIFQKRPFRAAAFGYFGHMWELYAFWTFVPVVLTYFFEVHQAAGENVSLYSFLVIGSGSLACVAGGYLARFFGTKKTAATALLLSGSCCILSPLFFLYASESLFLFFLVFWGLVVVADSPLFSTLVAQNAPAESRGTALTIVNSIGFAITIISIQLLTFLFLHISPDYLFLILSAGPALGLLALFRRKSFSLHKG